MGLILHLTTRMTRRPGPMAGKRLGRAARAEGRIRPDPAARSATVRKPEAYATLCGAGGRTLRGGSVYGAGAFARRDHWRGGTFAPKRGVGLPPCGSSPSRAAESGSRDGDPTAFAQAKCGAPRCPPRGWAGNAWGRGPLVRNAARQRASRVAAAPDIQPSSRVRLGDAGEAARAPGGPPPHRRKPVPRRTVRPRAAKA
jgi:hypothetical protein